MPALITKPINVSPAGNSPHNVCPFCNGSKTVKVQHGGQEKYVACPQCCNSRQPLQVK